MKLSTLIASLNINFTDDIEIKGIAFDSRQVEPGYLFVAISGTQTDGHKYLDQAVENGAVAIVLERLPEEKSDHVKWIKVPNSAEALGLMANVFYNNPSSKLKLVGVSGTNGKTSVVTMLHQLVMSMGYEVGLISTVQNQVGEKIIPSTHTTPDPISLNRLLAEMVDEGCDYCFMEVSSHAIDQHRVAGIHFSGAVFTNITHDHLDYHRTFANYISAKKKLFDEMPFESFALYNKDDRNGRVMVQNFAGSSFSFGLKTNADFKVKILEHDFEGMLLEINGSQAWYPLCGQFNAYNLVAVYGVAVLLEFEHEEIIKSLTTIHGAKGRFQILRNSRKIKAIVDYAHTPDALKNVLETINQIRTRNEQLITVVGCGGNRDVDKRPLMAALASKHSDKVVLTSDNPRDEDPEDILQQMMAGVEVNHMRKVLKITQREEAIQVAANLASEGDIILIAGKGHETYQEIRGEKHPFDDKEMIHKYLKMNE